MQLTLWLSGLEMARAQVCRGVWAVSCWWHAVWGCCCNLLAAVVILLSVVLLAGWHRQGGAAEGSRILR